MSDIDQLKGSPFEEVPSTRKIPGLLNVLTILTFIGCAIGILGSLYNNMNAKQGLEKLESMQGSEELEKMPSFLKQMFSPEAVELARKSYENRVPIIIISTVSLVLCLMGAVQMRQLKKQGYYLYIIGEILPLITTVIFIGAAGLTGFIGYLSIGITALFVILYSTQLKYLR